LGEQLRPLLAELRHVGGSGEWQTVDGSWQLTLQLPESGRAADHAITAIVRQIALPVPAIAPQPESIAIHQLLNHLPERLTSSTGKNGWLAALVGGSAGQAQRLARQLNLPGVPINAETTSFVPCRGGIERLPHASNDTALLIFIPLPEGAPLAALRLLALLCEPQFFQRLRVEQQIGYVVSCRYQRLADRDGLLLALQSPDRSVLNLLRCCKTFLRELTLCNAGEFRILQQQLAEQARSPAKASAAALSALRQRYGLPDITPQSIDELRYDEVIALWRELTRRRRRWRILFSAPSIPIS
jgi:pyrroloquinoline quinone synthesis related protease (pqqF). Metallo peptidase. MEROPS family M16A